MRLISSAVRIRIDPAGGGGGGLDFDGDNSTSLEQGVHGVSGRRLQGRRSGGLGERRPGGSQREAILASRVSMDRKRLILGRLMN
ncbi:MAG: hypothetical protein ACF8PN_05500 [Phycisphaerales bacterium]